MPADALREVATEEEGRNAVWSSKGKMLGRQEAARLLVKQRSQEADKTCHGPCSPQYSSQTVCRDPTKGTRVSPQTAPLGEALEYLDCTPAL